MLQTLSVRRRVLGALLVASGLLAAAPVSAAEDRVETAESVAQELANPLAPVTTLTGQARVESGWGPADDTNYTLRLQPSFFVPLEGKSALLLRTILPLRLTTFPAREAGLGDVSLVPYFVPDITQSVFVGFGGALVLPTASDATLGTDRWSAGPAVIVARAGDPWTFGALGQHVWSFAGDDRRDDVNVTTVQPFVTRLLGNGWSLSVNAETTYNHAAGSGGRWTVPLAVAGARVLDVGGRFVNVAVGYVEYLEGPEAGPERELRLNVTYVLR